jgi:phosphopantothenoylcysteine decarboxylase/phosphopantothenate--cysteine ligase
MMHAVLTEFPAHDLLIMAAAVSDYRPRKTFTGKIERTGPMSIDLEPTDDILAAVSRIKRPDQRTVGFSLESGDVPERAPVKLIAKSLDMIVVNPLSTMTSPNIQPVLLHPDGHRQTLPSMAKTHFAIELLSRCTHLFT